MKPPRLPGPYPDRHLDCQESLEPAIIALIDEAKSSGWSVTDITTAIVALADNLMLAEKANEDTDRQIAEALRNAQTP